MIKVSFVHGDITEQNVDVTVNAANSTLLGGGGVDGVIHRAAGPELLAERNNCKTIAFPAISTGVYGYPKKEAAGIVYQTITDFIKQVSSFEEICLVLHSAEDLRIYQEFFRK